jgi:TatA/E family protein of Tat protein translocase
MSFADTAVLFVLALLLFGPKKLPVIARQIGKMLNEFKRASNEFKAQIESEINQLEFQEKQKARDKEQAPEQKILPPAVPAESVQSTRPFISAAVPQNPTGASSSAPSSNEVDSATASQITHV